MARSVRRAVNAFHPITLGNASQLLLAWSTDNAALTLAFAASDSDNASLTQPVSTLHPAEYLTDFFGGDPPNINPAALDPFMEALEGLTAPDGAINNVTGGQLQKLRKRIFYELFLIFFSVKAKDSCMQPCGWQPSAAMKGLLKLKACCVAGAVCGKPP